jgi:IMP dehydrogenase
MVSKVKKYKAGFVTSDSNVTPDATLAGCAGDQGQDRPLDNRRDGGRHGQRRLLGIVTSRDYRISRTLPARRAQVHDAVRPPGFRPRRDN